MTAFPWECYFKGGNQDKVKETLTSPLPPFCPYTLQGKINLCETEQSEDAFSSISLTKHQMDPKEEEKVSL